MISRRKFIKLTGAALGTMIVPPSFEEYYTVAGGEVISDTEPFRTIFLMQNDGNWWESLDGGETWRNVGMECPHAAL